MLNKAVYEVLPVLYLALGIVLFWVFESNYGFFSGIIFYVIGTITWIARSKYRRKDKVKRRIHGLFPSSLYEELPFIYIASGIFFIVYFERISFWPSALLLIMA